jgi:hypothetical protein
MHPGSKYHVKLDASTLKVLQPDGWINTDGHKDRQ